MSGGKKEIQAHHNCILSILLKSTEAEKVICHPNCLSVSLSPFLTVFLFLLPPGWSGQMCGHRKLCILRRMEDVLWGDKLHSPPPPSHPLATPKWHLTPSCVYIRPWKWEIVMSHSGCVFTLWSHARKEISHGLLKVARWERIAAVHQSYSDLPLRARIYFMSSRLQRPLTNRKQQL